MSTQELTLSGPPFERGAAWGRAAGPTIREFLADRLARINALRAQPLSLEQAEGATASYGAVLRQWVPELFAEIQGLAHGAEIPEWQALLLQLRRELSEDRSAADCSLLAVAGAGVEPVLAQTIDLSGGLTELGRVVRIVPESLDEPKQLLYTFLGLTWYLGLNDRGLAVGINMVLADGWKPGIPPYLLVRRLLAQSSIAACIEELRRLPRSSSRALTLCDGQRVVSVEMTPTDLRVLEGDTLVHTNHYLHSDLLTSERANVLSRRSSKARYARLGALLSSEGPAHAAGRAFDWLSDHEGGALAICCHGNGDVRRSETVAAVVICPNRRTLAARRGPPCRSTEQIYTI